jgi:hypothetical protein
MCVEKLRTIVRLLFCSFAICAPSLASADSKLLSTAEITQQLNNRFFQGRQDDTDWVQRFESDGTTTYSSGRSISKGRWKVETNLYCSIWGNETRWDCWQVSAKGDNFKFISVDKPSDIWAAKRLP